MTKERNAVLLEVGELVRGLQRRQIDDAAVLDELTRSAARFVPGAHYAGITVVRPTGEIETVAATHHYAVALDDVQRHHRQGPCLSAGWQYRIIRIDDLSAEERWPRYRNAALALTPIRSVLSLQLFADPKSIGALNFYAETTQVFDDESVELGLVFATHTALVWNIVLRNEQFHSALASRDIIGQAKGMIMERFDVDAVHAFELLKRLSQNSNTPLAEIARRLVDANHPPR